MGLTLRGEKGSKLTIEELDSNLLGLKNLTFVGEDFSNLGGDIPVQAGFYGETITKYGPNLQGIYDALDLGTASFFYSPAVFNDTEITYFGTKVMGTASGEGFDFDAISLSGFLRIKGYEGLYGNGGYTNIVSSSEGEIVQLVLNIDTALAKISYGFGYDYPHYNHFLMVQSPVSKDPIIHYQIDVNSETEEITVTVKTLMEQV